MLKPCCLFLYVDTLGINHVKYSSVEDNIIYLHGRKEGFTSLFNSLGHIAMR